MNKKRYTPEEIREHKRDYHRRYILRRKEENNPVDFSKYKRKRAKKEKTTVVEEPTPDPLFQIEMRLKTVSPFSKEYEQIIREQNNLLIKISNDDRRTQNSKKTYSNNGCKNGCML